MKPPGPAVKEVAEVKEEIKEEESSDHEAGDVFSEDFRSGTVDSAYIRAANESQSEDKIAQSGGSIEWVLTLAAD